MLLGIPSSRQALARSANDVRLALVRYHRNLAARAFGQVERLGRAAKDALAVAVLQIV